MSDHVFHGSPQVLTLDLARILGRPYTAPANSIHDCVECDKPIGIQRKAAIPFATRCVDCQSKLERKR